MAGKEANTKNANMAADLKRRGILHGRRLTTSRVKSPTSYGPGSTKYQRYQESKQARRIRSLPASDGSDYRKGTA